MNFLRDLPESEAEATINCDDPPYFGGYVAANYRAVADARGLDRDALPLLARNSFLDSFLSGDEVAERWWALDDFAAGEAGRGLGGSGRR